MIYEFTVENFRSFGKAQTLTLIKGRERNKPENLTSGPEGFPQAVRVAAVFGHNASGKSNLIRAAQSFAEIVRSSAAVIYPGNLIPEIVPHRLSDKWKSQPCRFETVFPASDGRVFRYFFAALTQRIAEERLVEEMPSGRSLPIFTRHTDDANKTTVDFHRGSDFEAVAREQIRKLTRETSLVLSSGANVNVPLLRDIFGLITERSLFLQFSPLPVDVGTHLARLVNDDATLSRQLQAFLRDADVGIRELRIPKAPPPDDARIAAVADQLRPIHGANAQQVARRFVETGTRRQVHSVHETTGGREVEFDWGEESTGTQRFAALFCFLALAAKNGWTVLVDEFGSHIHPLLAERLVAWFQNPQHHAAAQFIFTTHYTQLLTPRLFRKDQIWFAEKTQAGESELACLADFHGENAPRSTEAFDRNYLAGVYGAIGDFGPYLSGVRYESEKSIPADASPPPEAHAP